MTPAPFVDHRAELYLCQNCQSFQWTDLHHACDAHGFWSTERAFAAAITVGCAVWVVVVVGIWRAAT